jgi:hypothetical protein
MTWIYRGKEYTPKDLDPKKLYGFVYEITNLNNGKKYIGKKFFWRKKTFQKNLKRKKKIVESDWKDYYGSSELLLEDIVEVGRDNFERVILKLCKTKSECSYFEAKYQFDRKVLESDKYYNKWIMVKVRKSHLTKYFTNT